LKKIQDKKRIARGKREALVASHKAANLANESANMFDDADDDLLF
jgi:hypothetical protein